MIANLFGISDRNVSTNLFIIFAGVVLISMFVGVATDFYYLAVLPLLILIGYIAVVDFKKLFYLLFMLIPFSVEMTLPGGIGTDFPSEGLIVGLMLVYLLYFFKNIKTIDSAFFKHPITVLVLLHFVWTAVTTIHSYDYVVSIKFLLAKFWYIVVFYFLAGLVLKNEKNFKALFWCIHVPLFLTIVYVMVRHSTYGFSFKNINSSVGPFYRNHVMYGCIVALFLPFIWYVWGWYKRWSFAWWVLLGSLLFALLAVQLSYTRAAYIGIFIAIGSTFLVRFRLMKVAVGAAILLTIAAVIHLVTNNTYMDYAPEYKTTVTHTNFDNLITATAQGKDISTMERVYRWVAGYQMSRAEPLTGFGPGNFYNFYRSYTVTGFKTYVSNNPEKSGIHNYYLMTIVEQGFPAVIIFLVLCFYMLIRGETVYHQTASPKKKEMVMTVILTSIIIYSLLLINDMIETDKVGSFFFICLAILVNLDVENGRQLKNPNLKK